MRCGENVLMWKDMWLEEVLSDTHPRAFSFVRNEDCSVKDFLTINSLGEAFFLPLSTHALEEVQDMQSLVTYITLDNSQNTKDVWTYLGEEENFQPANTTNSTLGI